MINAELKIFFFFLERKKRQTPKEREKIKEDVKLGKMKCKYDTAGKGGRGWERIKNLV